MKKALIILAAAIFALSFGCRDEESSGDSNNDSSDDDDNNDSSASGESSCNDYVDAVVDCYTEAGGDPSLITDSVTCAGQPATWVDYYGCLTNAYIDADCSDAMSLATLDVSNCVTP